MPPDARRQLDAHPPGGKPDDPPGLDLDALADRIAARITSPTAAPDRRMLDLDGVASRLNVSPRTVESIVAAGEIPVVRIGAPGKRGVRRFDPAAVEAYVRRQTRAL